MEKETKIITTARQSVDSPSWEIRKIIFDVENSTCMVDVYYEYAQGILKDSHVDRYELPLASSDLTTITAQIKTLHG